MASPVSSTRSAARATYSAYKRQPIRWRLAGGSRRAHAGHPARLRRDRRHAHDAGDLQRLQPPGGQRGRPAGAEARSTTTSGRDPKTGKPQFNATVPLDAYASSTNAAIRVVYPDGRRFDGSTNAPSFGPPDRGAQGRSTAGGSRRASCACIPAPPTTTRWASSTARRISDVRATANRVKLFLGLGVLGGAALALLAGLATARRAMEPIAELTDAAREIERTRDATVQHPAPGGRRRGGRAGHDARVDAARARRRRARRPRPRWPASASSSPTPRTSCARR